MLKEFKRIQAYFFLCSAVVGVTLYFHTTFASSIRVQSLEDKLSNIQVILCEMAIDQKLPKASKICNLQGKYEKSN